MAGVLKRQLGNKEEATDILGAIIKEAKLANAIVVDVTFIEIPEATASFGFFGENDAVYRFFTLYDLSMAPVNDK